MYPTYPSNCHVLSRVTGKTVDNMKVQQALQGLGAHTVPYPSEKARGTSHNSSVALRFTNARLLAMARRNLFAIDMGDCLRSCEGSFKANRRRQHRCNFSFSFTFNLTRSIKSRRIHFCGPASLFASASVAPLASCPCHLTQRSATLARCNPV